MALDNMSAREWIVEPSVEAEAAGDRHRLTAEPGSGSPAAAIAEDDRRNALGRGRHRMAVEQQQATVPVQHQLKLLLDRLMVGPVRLLEALLKLLLTDRSPPEEAVLLRPSRNDPEAASRPSGYPAAPGAIDHRWVDLILGSVAIDCRARRPGDDGSNAALDCSPYQPVDVGILKGSERIPATRGHRD